MDRTISYLFIILSGVIPFLLIKGNPVPSSDQTIYCFQNHTPKGNFGPCDTEQTNPNDPDGENQFDSAESCCAQAGAAGFTQNRSGSRCSPCSSLEEEVHVGGENETDVIDGEWSAWDPWSDCSVTCGIGVKTKARTCTNPAPQNGGANCTGNANKAKECDMGSCTINGNWGPWGEFGECSDTCGHSATRSRTRECNDPAPMNGGSWCEGEEVETTTCNNLPNCPIDGVWSAWGQWSECSVTCGSGHLSRYRSCNNPAPQHGGEDCSGDNVQLETCTLTACPIHGGWSEWSSWQSCSATECNEVGWRLRSHSCTNPRPQHGGRYCQGPSYGKTICTNTDACPVDGSWGEWGAWSECSETCGLLSQRERRRECDNPPPTNGGDPCPGRGVDLDASACGDLPPCPTEMPDFGSGGCDDEDADCQGSGSGSSAPPTEDPCNLIEDEYYRDVCLQGIADVPGNEDAQPTTEKMRFTTGQSIPVGGGGSDGGGGGGGDNAFDYSLSSSF